MFFLDVFHAADGHDVLHTVDDLLDVDQRVVVELHCVETHVVVDLHPVEGCVVDDLHGSEKRHAVVAHYVESCQHVVIHVVDAQLPFYDEKDLPNLISLGNGTLAGTKYQKKKLKFQILM